MYPVLRTILTAGAMTAGLTLAVTSPATLPGETIRAEEATRFVLPEQPVHSDTGINVLLDLAHEAQFHMMWSWPGAMREKGFRVVGSHASLDTVLDPRGHSRIRVPDGVRRPFAWWPNPEFNVVVSFQHNPRSQPYLPEEVAALEGFIQGGGGLVLSAAPVRDPALLEGYPLAQLARRFGANLTAEVVEVEGLRGAVWQLGPGWTPLTQSPDGRVVSAWRTVGRGRVVVLGQNQALWWDGNAGPGTPLSRDVRTAAMAEIVTLAAGGRAPVGGTRSLPMADIGVGGPIYPELEERVGGAVMFYSRNQFPEVLEAIRRDSVEVDRMVRHWSPAPAPNDPMFIIMASGYGGGWAVNIYEPKEVGVIAPEPYEILSILAHEVAHTVDVGPLNDRGQSAGRLPDVFIDAHAGWFQRKANTLLQGVYLGHDPNGVFQFDPDGTQFDLARSEGSPYGQAWTKLWWIWQKLDDRYGPTWYPRWLWVKNQRWADTPDRRLTWDEVVEDMSIAVGEDLFPFMRKVGTTLSKDRFPSAVFMGQQMVLPVAEIELRRVGRAHVLRIGDYRQPLRRPTP